MSYLFVGLGLQFYYGWSEYTDKNRLIFVYMYWSEWAKSAASLTKRKYRIVVFFFTFVLFQMCTVDWRLSDLVCSLTSRVGEQKACFNNVEKKILKRVGARTHPCFTPLLIVNDSETLPSYWTVAFVLMWKDFTMLKRLGGWRADNFQQYRKQSFPTYSI